MAEVQSVQAIASLSTKLDAIPSEFVRSEHEQPGVTTFRGPTPEIPVVDMSDGDRERVLRAMAEAASEWGIFQVVNHGIPEEVVKELQRVGKCFFELPQEEKEKYAMSPESGKLEGYGTKLRRDQLEGTKTWVDFFFHNIAPPSRVNYAVWPQEPEDYRKANEEYTKYMLTVVDDILACLSLGLGLDKNVLKEASGGDELTLLQKINFYPPCPQPDLTLGVPPHTDMSAITVLVPNDVQGLQVFKDEHWYDAKYIPNALIIHIGDQIEILSNGKYKAVLHRTTVNKEKTRMSWPVFCEPPMELVVGPLPQLTSDDNPPKYKAKKYKDYQYCKINKLPQ